MRAAIATLAAIAALVTPAALAGCDALERETPPGYQGVAELDTRAVGFEAGGRIAAVPVARGDRVEAGATVATLDDALAKSALAAQRATLEAAEAKLALVEAGPREEDIRATAARVHAAERQAAVARRDLDRQRKLARRGATPEAKTDALRAQAAAAEGQLDALREQLRALREGSRPEEVRAAKAAVEAETTDAAVASFK